jgi:SAM-dependent methyltransferase
MAVLEYAGKVKHRANELGYAGVFRYSIMRVIDLVNDYVFDLRHGVHTTGATMPLVEGGEGYKASLPKLLTESLARLPIEYEDYTYLDLGSGKGRGLLLAAAFPFRAVIGVELVPELHAIAEANIRKYRGVRRCALVRSAWADAREFAIPDGPLVAYLYHPFTKPVLEQVLERLRASLEREPRTLYVIYLRPLHAETLERCAFLKAVYHRRSMLIEHFDYIIYKNAGTSNGICFE